MHPLGEFLAVAVVCPSATHNNPLTIQSQAGLAGPVPSPAVISFRRDSILCRDLTGLRPTTSRSGGEPTILELTRSVRDFVSTASMDRTDRAEARDIACMPKTVRERLGGGITDRLLLMCQVSNDDDLLPVYHEWVAQPRVFQSDGFSSSQWKLPALLSLRNSSKSCRPKSWRSKTSGPQVWRTLTSEQGSCPSASPPEDGTSSQDLSMLEANQIRADAFNLSADPKSGVILPSIIVQLHVVIKESEL
jgi:hypothetical protein